MKAPASRNGSGARTGAAVILHVEDDPNDLFFVQRAFAKLDEPTDLHAVRDGDEAIQYLSGVSPYDDRTAHPWPTLVLMDVKLPKRSGLEILEWMRGDPKLSPLPVVMLSSSSEPADIARAYALGVNAYVVKTGDLRELIQLVRGVVTFAEMVKRP